MVCMTSCQIMFYCQQGPLLLTWIDLDPSKTNYIHHNVRDEITYPFPNINAGAAIEVWEWISNFQPAYWACDFLSMLWLKLKKLVKWVPVDTICLVRIFLVDIFIYC